MSKNAASVERRNVIGTPIATGSASLIPIYALGLSLGLFLAVTYTLCVVFDLWLPKYAMYPVWSALLPGFTWITWPSFFLGLLETFAYGWYVALVFGLIYNFINRKFGRG